MFRTAHVRSIACALGAPFLLLFGGCEGIGPPPVIFPERPSDQAVYGAERGSVFEPVLTGDDKRSLAEATGRLLRGNTGFGSAGWAAPSGANGQVSVGAPYLIGLDANAGARIPAPSGIDTSIALSPASGNFKTVKNANVRLGPNTDAAVAQTLPAGTVVRAYGYAKDLGWYLVGEADAILGYTSAELLEAAGGNEPLLAGGKPKRPRLCRDLSMTLTMADGRKDAWSNLVCTRDDGTWEVPKERGLV